MSKKFYITTAIDYVNSDPHLGHAYEKICADVIARWHRLKGSDVFFLTGTDENAQKNVQAAKEKGMDIKEFVEKMSLKFLELCKKLNISNDDFIRTTEERHVKAVQHIFSEIYKKGDIYKGKYSGLYCQGCEAFYTEKGLIGGLCPEHETKPISLEEENYFFRLSKYKNKILEVFEKNPEFVKPSYRRNEMIERLKAPLRDISISRYKVDWGIEFPFDKNHKIYVWVEALSNYVTALGYPKGKYKRYWPADIHIIGTGINWFHSVIWPALLMSVGLPIPKQIFVHGYITHEGRKMSKSIGNVVDPFDILNKYGPDPLRYFLIREIPMGEDGDFSEEALIQRINGELVSDLGNLVNRVVTIGEKFAGKIEGKDELGSRLDLEKIENFMETLQLHLAVKEIFNFIRECNKYINQTEPWRLKGKELGHVLYNLAEGIRVAAVLLHAFMPETSDKIRQQLGLKELEEAKFGKFKGKIRKGELLFRKVSV